MRLTMKRAAVRSIVVAVMLLAVPVIAEAQQKKKIPRIAVLMNNAKSSANTNVQAFQQALKELGYVEGKNIMIEYRYGEDRLDQLPRLAAELVRLNPDLIFAPS